MSMEDEMNMVEILSEELGQKELKIMALEKKLKEQENRMKEMMKENLINYIKTNEDFIDDGFSINSNDRMEWDELLEEMNENDWNEDDCYCELYMDSSLQIMTRMKECYHCIGFNDEDLIPYGDSHYICKECHKKEMDSSSEEDDTSDDSSEEEDIDPQL